MDLAIISETQHAEKLEAEGKLEEAAKLYEAVIRTATLDEHPYNRLMIIYRKLKQPKDEFRVIKTAIARFESKYIKRSRSKKLTDLSNALMRSSGLTNAKGKLLVYPEPIGKWMKRKELVEKKLKK
jgi:DNA-binding SARP family transcriptional activator